MGFRKTHRRTKKKRGGTNEFHAEMYGGVSEEFLMEREELAALAWDKEVQQREQQRVADQAAIEKERQSVEAQMEAALQSEDYDRLEELQAEERGLPKTLEEWRARKAEEARKQKAAEEEARQRREAEEEEVAPKSWMSFFSRKSKKIKPKKIKPKKIKPKKSPIDNSKLEMLMSLKNRYNEYNYTVTMNIDKGVGEYNKVINDIHSGHIKNILGLILKAIQKANDNKNPNYITEFNQLYTNVMDTDTIYRSSYPKGPPLGG